MSDWTDTYNVEERAPLWIAETLSRRGREAGRMPSPPRTIGTVVTQPTQTRFASMREAYAAACEEHGYRMRSTN